MKKIITIIAAVLFLSCSSEDNCKSNKDAINLKYDNQIQYVRDHPGPNGIDFRQITLLNEERSKKLAQDCKQ